MKLDVTYDKDAQTLTVESKDTYATAVTYALYRVFVHGSELVQEGTGKSAVYNIQTDGTHLLRLVITDENADTYTSDIYDHYELTRSKKKLGILFKTFCLIKTTDAMNRVKQCTVYLHEGTAAFGIHNHSRANQMLTLINQL